MQNEIYQCHSLVSSCLVPLQSFRDDRMHGGVFFQGNNAMLGNFPKYLLLLSLRGHPYFQNDVHDGFLALHFFNHRFACKSITH